MLSRGHWDEMINIADRMFTHYYAFNDASKCGRNPATVVRRMVACLPSDEKYDYMYSVFAVAVHAACQSNLANLDDTFWTPMKTVIIPRYIGKMDTDWKLEIASIMAMEK